MDDLLTHASKNGLCSRQEYEAILFEITSKSPCNVLVFGLGFDALLWIVASGGGRVHFIENSGTWIDKCVPIPNVHKVAYRTSKWAQDTIHPADQLYMNYGPEIEGHQWDVIFVDSPRGKTQGRMKSIHNAHRLATGSDHCTVFVHDYPRPCENLYVNHYFGEENVELIKRLAKIQL